jgi:hypothetical protein
MPAEKIHRKPSAKACFGNPPDSEWYKGIHEGRYPAPDVQLGPCTPGWTDGHIARHQEVMRRVATEGRERRSVIARRVRRGGRAVENSPTT